MRRDVEELEEIKVCIGNEFSTYSEFLYDFFVYVSWRSGVAFTI